MKKLLIVIGSIVCLSLVGNNYKRELVRELRQDVNGYSEQMGARERLEKSCATETVNPLNARSNSQAPHNETAISEDENPESALDFGVYIPNTFTPNNDGLNDVFNIYGFGIQKGKITIYNRWGEMLYTSNCLSSGWDGSYDEKPCEVATYIYILEYSTEEGNSFSKIGYVNLVK